MLPYITLYYPQLPYITLYYPILPYITLYYPILPYITLYFCPEKCPVKATPRTERPGRRRRPNGFGF